MTVTIKDLLDKRARLITEARGYMEQITSDTTEERSADLERQFEAAMNEADECRKKADQLQRLSDAEESLDAGDPRRPRGEDGQQEQRRDPGQMDYAEAFQHYLAVGGDIHEMPAEARAALRRGDDRRAQAIGGMTEMRAQVAGIAGAGGHIVPEESHTAIVKAMADWGPMFDDDYCQVIRTEGGGNIPIPGVDDTDGRAGTAAEAAQIEDDGSEDVVFTRKDLQDHMAQTKFLRVSLQLMTGGMADTNALLGGLLGERLGRTANADLTNGSGVNEPHGIRVAAGLGHTTTAQGDMTANDILRLYHSVNSAYRRSPKFGLQFNDNTLLKLHMLTDADGKYLLSEAPDGGGKIKIGAVSVRYRINDDMPDMGAGARSMIAGDMGKYYVRKIGRVMIVTARDSNFLPGYGIMGFTRYDGVLADDNAVKALEHASG